MIDLDKYESAIKEKTELHCGGVIATGRDDLLLIITRLRQAEKDAARYRWLRDEAEDQDLHVATTLESLEWDTFIDEAMNASNN